MRGRADDAVSLYVGKEEVRDAQRIMSILGGLGGTETELRLGSGDRYVPCLSLTKQFSSDESERVDLLLA